MSCRPAFPIIELPSPFSCENGVVRLLEERGMSQEVLQRKLLQEEYDRPFVFDNGLTRSLYFSLRYVQSSMRTRDPIAPMCPRRFRRSIGQIAGIASAISSLLLAMTSSWSSDFDS